ncbi:methyl-accepting chemotaxis sensory transducer with Pas/Pac sensor [Andreprevotia lacus DSM 23236]|jgi:aerotaxis receptor|uniref:Methyl-accepting chemotaxis sensory transducer with Pas/Pac sensor n=1 Tax=Andreprevotia lacus DSM 23236 TaxID=1121001 RepID=A0A1W1XE93_9NEIS|nr:PAS domain-containing methyl-accepting chemotaxis protein [Andreprevotia lacus]SMC21821.1 methyl-accepting chemotaxis sensory transducer with Pas/Pac sensor [Andreprevotia lacus DSM 23236]
MRRNEPVTQREVDVDPKRPIVSKTNLKGQLVYANPAFVDISGFERSELEGQPHNIVRHPDMPPQAFEDLWRTIKSKLPWRGLVKNRCKNGDHYWVEAFVTPLFENGQHTGFMSVRNTPTRQQVSDAEQLYLAVNSGQATFPATRWPSTLGMKWRLAIVMSTLMLLTSVNVFLSGPAAWAVAGASLLAAISGWFWLQASWQAPLREASNAFSKLSEGNFRFSVNTRAPSEFASLLLQLESMRINLRAVIADVVSAANQVGERANELARESDTLAKRSRVQSDGVASVAAALEQLTVSVREINDSTHQSARHADNASQLSTRGSGEVSAAQRATHDVLAVVDTARETLSQLEHAVGEINSVTQTIKEIAGQTNLLALNAAIEAARAGETGRGFAVVADEVRKLAERTRDSTGTITATIETIATRTSAAMAGMMEAVAAVESGTGLIDHCNITLQEIAGASQGVNQAARDVSVMLEQQSQAANEVANSMERMSTLTEQNADTIADVGSSAQRLAGVAKELHQLVMQFEKSL